MRTDDLIAELAVQPWPATRPSLRLAFGLFVGWLVALAGLVIAFGSPLAAVPATGVTPFTLKLGYSLALAASTAAAVLATGRPGQRIWPRALLIALPFGLIGLAASMELAATPPADWNGLLLGSTFATCVASIALASVPVFAGLLWAFRALAPTEPVRAGFLSGLCAGAAGAVAYALYCPETTASFLFAAYTPGMLVPALLGALLGPRLLRW